MMRNKKQEASRETVFPSVDRSVVTVDSSFEPSGDKAFWLAKTPLERLEAVELYRQIAFGYDPLSTRLQRIIEVAEFPPRDSMS